MPQRPTDKSMIDLEDAHELGRLGEAIIRLEEAIERQGQMSDEAKEQRTQILTVLEAVRGHVEKVSNKVDDLEKRMGTLEPIVKEHEKERQQSIGRRALLIGVITLGASMLGGIVSATVIMSGAVSALRTERPNAVSPPRSAPAFLGLTPSRLDLTLETGL